MSVIKRRYHKTLQEGVTNGSGFINKRREFKAEAASTICSVDQRAGHTPKLLTALQGSVNTRLCFLNKWMGWYVSRLNA